MDRDTKHDAVDLYMMEKLVGQYSGQTTIIDDKTIDDYLSRGSIAKEILAFEKEPIERTKTTTEETKNSIINKERQQSCSEKQGRF